MRIKLGIILFLLCYSLSTYGQSYMVAIDDEKLCRPSDDTRIVPNVLGLSEDKAKERLSLCDLEYRQSPHKAISHQSIDAIAEQRPHGGVPVKKGESVVGVLSKGILLPDFSGRTADDVFQWAKELELKVEKKSSRHQQPVGNVFRQFPIAGRFFNAATPITIYVSEGLYVDLPDGKNKRYYAFKAELEDLNLVVKHGGGSLESGSSSFTICEINHWYPVVDVMSPVKGTRVYENNTITLTTKKRTEFLLIDPPPGQLCP